MRFLLFLFCVVGLFAQENSMFFPDQNAQNPQEILQESLESPANIDETLVAKNVYLKPYYPKEDNFYVHQIISVEIELLILNNYSHIATHFLEQDESVEVLNPEENWTLNQDSTLKNTFYFKIKQPSYTIPKIEVIVKTDDGWEKAAIEPVNKRAMILERAGNYSKVLAQNLEVLETKISSYDSQNNLIVLQLQSQMGNLLDFYLDSYLQQGIESSSGDFRESMVFYYVVVPKSLEQFSFEYFNTKNEKYVALKIDNISQDERISTQSDIKPKNTFQIYKILVAIFLAVAFFGLYFYYKKKAFLILGVFVLLILVYLFSIKTSATLKPDVLVRIQPTFNSTIILTTQEATEVKILANKRGYYKVLLEDDRIGWVKENDIQN